ncbi:hypothetical protein ABB37_01993 [Leptomonas pyrrhocoris]|uniref:Uncharacterized protein n=1 Tax=Leptomonas pyrrhocoris TaxID=157538 RepID=A0A0N0VGP8_LEPPY|nr:hypothetical protein ABB37_01993 [Leptomonas pyrrhocoris]KPA83761.1 hypothetical protein ABB37_01993 [Leptomonas pyrrhocoris]|eukprot:XP_015662200.1 hypothetical protein ABB37_01993 [Leptomonas pyrrhocoris]
MSSLLITPSTSLNSNRSGKSPQSASLITPMAHEATATAAVYDSFLARWLLETVVVQRRVATVCGGLLYVDGTAVDLSTLRDVTTEPNINGGITCVLRCADDVHACLTQCEHAVRELAHRHSPHVPYHMWVAVRVGAAGAVTAQSEELPVVTFLDLAPPADGTGEGGPLDDHIAACLREQLRLFDRQLGSPASASASATELRRERKTTSQADERWLGFLRSCQLSRAQTIGVFSLAEQAGENPFNVAAGERGCDALALSAELRQRALEEAVNNGVVHPQHAAARHRQRRLKTKKKGTQEKDKVSPPTFASAESASSTSPQTMHLLVNTPQLPSLKQTPSSSRKTTAGQICREESLSGSYNDAANTPRVVARQAVLDAEEHRARGALINSEPSSRNASGVRRALQVRPPDTSVTVVARQPSRTVSRQRRQQVFSAPAQRPPPVPVPPQPGLAATARALRGSSKTPSAKPPDCTWHSPDSVHEVLPILSPSSAARHAVSSPTTPLYRLSPANSSRRRRRPRPDFLFEVDKRNDMPSSAASPTTSASPSRATSSRRRYSALEMALLERAHSRSPRSTPAATPNNGDEVELLYPLVCIFHAELTAQDNLMAAELMARSKIELREMHFRRKLEKLNAEHNFVVASPRFWSTSSGRLYAASPNSLRPFFAAY